MGYKASLKVDVKVFKESMSQGTKFGEHKVVFKSGGPDLPEPIGLKLVPIDEAFDVNFYSVIDAHQSTRCAHSDSLLRTRKANVQEALKEYPRLKKAQIPVGKSNGPFAPNVHMVQNPACWRGTMQCNNAMGRPNQRNSTLNA